MNAQRPQVSWLAAHGKGNIEVLEASTLRSLRESN